MGGDFDWANHSGDAWTRRWREIDVALSDLAPQLHSILVDAAPVQPFRALDIGCGAGSTSEQLAHDRPDATIIGCDLSPSLVQLAQDRLGALPSVQIILGDAQAIAQSERPFDLLFSRHGVMFFDDPVGAFRILRAGTSGGATLIFSCFQDWRSNPWASELASAAADKVLPPPGREAGGFAFAEPAYVQQVLESAGWGKCEVRSAPFRYAAGTGPRAVDQAMEFLTEIGPASRTLWSLPEGLRGAAKDRMRRVIERHQVGERIEFSAAAWLWAAQADK